MSGDSDSRTDTTKQRSEVMVRSAVGTPNRAGMQVVCPARSFLAS